MGSLLLRHRAMMLAAGEPTPVAIQLINGSYANGKCIISSGNTITLSKPSQWGYIVIPLTQSISLAAGDTVSFCFVSRDGGKGINFGFVLNGTNTVASSTTKPDVGRWYTITVDNSALFTGIFYRPRELNDTTTSTVSIMHNSDVIF